MSIVRTCIVGMGIGRPNGSAIDKHPRGQVTALCDLEEDRMADYAKTLSGEVKLYTDYKKMCKDKEIDAVFVGTPNQWHVPVALEAIRNGKHVMVTKPLADSNKAAKKVVAAAEAAGVVNMMSLSTRFSDNVRYLGGLIRAGEFGDVYYGRALSIRRNGIPAWNLGFIKKGGGAFRDMGVHVLDAAWWLIGMPKPVTVSGVAGAKFGPKGLGYSGNVKKEVWSQYDSDDYAGGLIRFDNGAALQVESFWASHQPGEFQIELFGTDAGSTLNPLTIYKCNGKVTEDIKPGLPKETPAWDNIADNFISAILDGEECQAPLRHGMIVQEMMEAILESAATGAEIRLDK
ncbi:MAG: Gfo/Idh/MocA family oxidoreductase [Planctomycetota bacterium]|nr:Gfo/Idh/MocA family oxidoreductase [Planctomycetota bacterium]MDA1137602.1 Gfo/Idh/MocA family oxidoreductase [Planctomycetota bacterium]